MKIVKPNAEIVLENTPYEQVERIGRICYKSEDNMYDGSCWKFVNNLVKNQHFAMLEHGHYHFIVTLADGIEQLPADFVKIPYVLWDELPDGMIIESDNAVSARKTFKNFLVTVSLSHLFKDKDSSKFMQRLGIAHVTDTYQCDKYIISTIILDRNGIKKLFQGCGITNASERTKYELINILNKHIHVSIKFTCDRGVSHELVRHRCSVAQESTRYCNYSNDKFNNELSFVQPSQLLTAASIAMWANLCKSAEKTYLHLVSVENVLPETARSVLPNSLKTEVVLTMPIVQWRHFMKIRLDGTTGKPHPDMKIVANIAHDKLIALEDSLFHVTTEG